MPKETYDPNASGGGGGERIEPLEAGQYPNCVLEKIFAFRQKQKDEDTGNEFMRTKLSLYWNSGYNLPDSDEPFYLTDGFVTLSFHERSNLTKMLTALGYVEAGEPVEYEYELGGEYENQNFEALPVYEGGPKRDAEIPVATLKVNGRELIGATATLIVSVKPSGWNKIELVLPDAPKAPTRLGPRKTGVPAGKAEAPADTTAPSGEARGSGTPVWSAWRTRAQAIKWAATLQNKDGSPAYQNKTDVEAVWEALWTSYELETFEPKEENFYRQWYRWHTTALEGKEFSFSDDDAFVTA